MKLFYLLLIVFCFIFVGCTDDADGNDDADLSSEERELLGTWESSVDGVPNLVFSANGTVTEGDRTCDFSIVGEGTQFLSTLNCTGEQHAQGFIASNATAGITNNADGTIRFASSRGGNYTKL